MTKVIERVLEKDPDGLHAQLAAGADPDEVDEFGFGALHFAALIGCGECCNELLAAGANPRLKTDAMATGSKEQRVIRPKGATLYIREFRHPGLPEGTAFDKGSTPLHVAASAGRLAIVDALLAAKARPIKDRIGATALHLAALGGHVDVVDRLLQENVAVDTRTSTRKSIVFFDKGMTALHAGLESGNLAVVNALLAAGADPNAKTDTPGSPRPDLGRQGQ